MKIFALCIGLVFGIFAIAVYAYGLKQRIKDVTDKSKENLHRNPGDVSNKSARMKRQKKL